MAPVSQPFVFDMNPDREQDACSGLNARIALELDARPAIGALLCSRWRLARELGIGGQATVYEAVHRNGRRQAIKLLHPGLARSVRARQSFLLEGYVANRIGHYGAIAIYDDRELDDGTPFLVMELLEGETLAARMKRRARALSCDEVLWAGDQLLDVLVAVHRAGVVHCDVKPGNVFVTDRGQLKLFDFGMATIRELAGVAPGARDPRTPRGTPGFMAPEQASERSDDLDARTDLWGFAATLFALLTGGAAHEGDTPSAAMRAARTGAVPQIRARIPDLDQRFAEWLQRALAFERDERWPSAAAMRDALRALWPLRASYEPRVVLGRTPNTDTVDGLSQVS
jgi:serine/threonine-protein kinase